MHRKTYSSSWFRYKSCLLKSRINSFNWIILHCQQKARTHLRLWSSCIEKSGSSMSKPFFTYHIISMNCWADITLVNTYRYSHYHMLRSFYDLSMNFEQVRFFESLVTKIIIVPISFINDSFIKLLFVFHYYFIYIVGNQTCIFSKLSFVIVKNINYIWEFRMSFFVKSCHWYSCSEFSIVRMKNIKISSCFCK